MASPTPYSSVPAMPTVNAMPGGVPYGPWQSLYRAAPGAQLPAVDLPGLRNYGMMGAFGAPQVKFMGLGQDNGAPLTKQQLVIGIVASTAIAAGIAAGFAMARDSGRPIMNPALFMGGVTLAGGLLTLIAKNGNGAAAAPAA